MVDESIVRGVRQYLRALAEQGIAAERGVLFGSYARGTAGQWSDIDLIVVSPAFDGQCSRELVGRLWRVAARTDNRIEPIPCGARQWREGSGGAPLLAIARDEGVVVELDER